MPAGKPEHDSAPRACPSLPQLVRSAILCVVALAGCAPDRVWPRLQERVGDAAVIHRRAGDETFLATDRQNLAQAAAFTPEERLARFAEFLNDFRRELGLNGEAMTLEFQTAADQVPLEWDGHARQTVFLAPVHQGASVVDRIQSAAFDTRTGELRAVLASAVDFAVLPLAPPGNSAARERARTEVLHWLETNDMSQGAITIRADPVISAQLGRAGYLVEYRSRDEGGAGHWIRFIFDPQAGELLILRHEERDDFPEAVDRARP
jgi:hypothetical protein